MRGGQEQREGTLIRDKASHLEHLRQHVSRRRAKNLERACGPERHKEKIEFGGTDASPPLRNLRARTQPGWEDDVDVSNRPPPEHKDCVHITMEEIG